MPLTLKTQRNKPRVGGQRNNQRIEAKPVELNKEITYLKCPAK